MSWLQYLRYLWYVLTGQEARRLNLRVRVVNPYSKVRAVDRMMRIFWAIARDNEGIHMAKIGDKVLTAIAPTNAAGGKAPVTAADFAELSDLYDFVSWSEDGLSATFVAVKSGTGATVTVQALSKAGLVLTDAKPLPDVDEPPVDEEAVALNLTVTVL